LNLLKIKGVMAKKVSERVCTFVSVIKSDSYKAVRDAKKPSLLKEREREIDISTA